MFRISLNKVSMKITLHLTILITACLASLITNAQEDTTHRSSHHLEEVEIKAGKTVNDQVLSVGKMPIKALDMPQSMTVINHELIAAQQGSRLSDVLKNTNGVALGTTRGSVTENFYARGYSLGANNILRNGLRSSSASIAEASTLERVEVLKGSSALLYGGVSGGAVINLVTKQPKFNYGGEVAMRAGSYSYFKPIVDLYGPLTKNLAFRVVSTYENSKSYRKEVKNERFYINPSLLYNFGSKTSLLVQGDYLKYDNTPDFGIGSLNGKIPYQISRNAFFNTPWAYNKVNQSTASATLNHSINNTWSVNVIGGYQVFNRNYFSTERIQADADGDWGRNLTRTKISERYFNGQINLTGKFNTGPISHVLLVGTDGERYFNISNVFNTFKTYDTLNILDPEKFVLRTDEPESTVLRRSETPTYRFGFYAQDLISLTSKLKVLAGVRWSYQKAAIGKVFDQATGAETRGTVATKYDKAFSPRVGIVYQPIATTSFFASYSNNFVPNSGKDINNANLKPSILDQYEVGVKNELIKGRLAVNLNYYKIVNSDFAQMAQYKADGTLNSDATIQEFSGQTTSDGFELDVMGKVTDNINVVGGYSYNHMRYTKTSGLKGSYIVGERLVNNTPHTANATIFYTFNNSVLNGFKAGLSVYYTGSRYGGWNNTVEQTQAGSRLIKVEGFTTVDVTLGYTFKKISLIAKLSNITNTLNYYVHENYSINPIPPRQVMTTLSYKF